jgi:hypothetical protein
LADLDSLVVGAGVRSGATKSPGRGDAGVPSSVTTNAAKASGLAGQPPNPVKSIPEEPMVSAKTASAATEAAVKEAVEAIKAEKDKELALMRKQIEEAQKGLAEKDAKVKDMLSEREIKMKKALEDEVQKVRTDMETQITKLKEEVESWKGQKVKSEADLEALKKVPEIELDFWPSPFDVKYYRRKVRL